MFDTNMVLYSSKIRFLGIIIILTIVNPFLYLSGVPLYLKNTLSNGNPVCVVITV